MSRNSPETEWLQIVVIVLVGIFIALNIFAAFAIRYLADIERALR